MKANELRIGNWVFDSDYFGNMIVSSIAHSSPSTTHPDDKGGYSLGLIKAIGLPQSSHGFTTVKPIPLTEEWRLKLGFKRRGISSRIKIGDTGMELCWYDNEKKLRLQTIKSGFTIPLDIKNEVHIIQNLFHALTSKELTLK